MNEEIQEQQRNSLEEKAKQNLKELRIYQNQTQKEEKKTEGSGSSGFQRVEGDRNRNRNHNHNQQAQMNMQGNPFFMPQMMYNPYMYSNMYQGGNEGPKKSDQNN